MNTRFRDRLREELIERRKTNPRYSLRAFSAFLGCDHATLSQILRAQRPAPAARVRLWARKLGMQPEEAAVYIAAEHLPQPFALARESQLQHWTAEALAIATGRAHWEIVLLSRTPEFQPDCRWIAHRIGVTVDEVNIALTCLLRLHLLRTTPDGNWIDAVVPPPLTGREFRKIAMARIREIAARG